MGSKVTANATKPDVSPARRILDGKFVNEGEWDFVCRIETTFDDHSKSLCTGTIYEEKELSEAAQESKMQQFIITGAHCFNHGVNNLVQDERIGGPVFHGDMEIRCFSKFKSMGGKFQLTSMSANVLVVLQLGWESIQHDIAKIKVTEALAADPDLMQYKHSWSKIVRPSSCIPQPPLSIGDKYKTAGWGGRAKGEVAHILTQADLVVVSSSKCRKEDIHKQLTELRIADNEFLCLEVQGGAQINYGDCGSPVICDRTDSKGRIVFEAIIIAGETPKSPETIALSDPPLAFAVFPNTELQIQQIQ